MGSGPVLRAGYENVDVRTNVGASIVMDISKTPYNFHDGQAIEIIYNHSFEHLPFAQHTPIIKECRRILRPGGKLIICVPDLRDFVKGFIHYIFETSYTAKDEKRISDARQFWAKYNTVINGEQLYPQDMHISIFDYGYYLMILKDAGFDFVEESYDARGLVVTASKGEFA